MVEVGTVDGFFFSKSCINQTAAPFFPQLYDDSFRKLKVYGSKVLGGVFFQVLG